MKVCFNGCSFTVGEGFPEHLRDQFIYDRLVCRELNLDHKNIAMKGSSNLLIFQRSLNELMFGDSDVLINQWSVLNRLWISPGPEQWLFANDRKFKTFSYRDIYINEKELTVFRNNLMVLNHDYQNIIDLCLYVETLNQLGEYYNKTVYHVNGLLPWQPDLITDYNFKDLSGTLSEYTKSLLDFDNRDDSEIIYFLINLQNTMKTLTLNKWVNLFDSWHLAKNDVDNGPEGHHPGIKSNQWMANKIINFLQGKI